MHTQHALQKRKDTTVQKKQKRKLKRIIIALVLFVIFELLQFTGLYDLVVTSSGVITIAAEYSVELANSNTFHLGLWIEFTLFLIPYLIAGYEVLAKAWHGIVHKQPFDENLLMAIATIGAFALVFFPNAEPHMAEGAAVMLFYQVGELFESYALGKTRKSIADMMDIAPDHANVMRSGQLIEVDPAEVLVGEQIVVKPGERIPLDGRVIEGKSQVDTAALTGESVPRIVEGGAEVISGCINLTSPITVEVLKHYGDSTVQRILELVENAAEKKARTENFVTRFARYYTPVVVITALLIAVLTPLFTSMSLTDCIMSALVFLVVSCPCALVISVPLSFFGGIGASSRLGIMVKGSSYLEALSKVNTVVFDKTGTLTNGTFSVVAVHPKDDIDPNVLLSYAAHAEAYSDHPIAISIKESFSGVIDSESIEHVEEQSGRGIIASVSSHRVAIGNGLLMEQIGAFFHDCELVGTVLHVALDGEYIGHIVIADAIKEDAATTIESLKRAGVSKTIMLTGDREEVAAAVANELGIDEYRAQLLPADKVAQIENLIDQEQEISGGKNKIAFVGDGINDAPVLMRADVGIAMGAMGSDAAIEAADIVLMDDKPSNIARAIGISRKTMRIVFQNIVFALAVKVAIMVLALPFIGIANMWLAVFGDVGVSVLAILNAMRAMRVSN